jgi:hypothetical protein
MAEKYFFTPGQTTAQVQWILTQTGNVQKASMKAMHTIS